MAEPGSEAEHKSDERSAHELSSCLLELSRLVRGIAFYPARDPHRRELLDRTFAAFDAELERCGELQLCDSTRYVCVCWTRSWERLQERRLAGCIGVLSSIRGTLILIS